MNHKTTLRSHKHYRGQKLGVESTLQKKASNKGPKASNKGRMKYTLLSI